MPKVTVPKPDVFIALVPSAGVAVASSGGTEKANDSQYHIDRPRVEHRHKSNLNT